MADPAASLAAEGVPVPPGITVKVVEDTDRVMHMVLPTSAANANELDDEALDLVAGGVTNLAAAPTAAALA